LHAGHAFGPRIADESIECALLGEEVSLDVAACN
jgi:hypothetical protein